MSHRRRPRPMPDAQLLALSPLDGRYAGKVDALRPIFSEFGLVKARVRVEVEWLLALANEPGIAELQPFSSAAADRLHAFAANFSPRSEERPVGKTCVSTGRSRWSPAHEKKKQKK